MKFPGPDESFVHDSSHPDRVEPTIVSWIFEIPTELIRRLVDLHPEAGRAVLGEVRSRFDQAQQAIGRVSAETATRRVAASLPAGADEFGVTKDGMSSDVCRRDLCRFRIRTSDGGSSAHRLSIRDGRYRTASASGPNVLRLVESMSRYSHEANLRDVMICQEE